MSIHKTRAYLEKLFPNRLGLTKQEVDFHTQGMSYMVEPQDGVFLIADVAYAIERMHEPKKRFSRQETIERFNLALERVWKEKIERMHH